MTMQDAFFGAMVGTIVSSLATLVAIDLWSSPAAAEGSTPIPVERVFFMVECDGAPACVDLPAVSQ